MDYLSSIPMRVIAVVCAVAVTVLTAGMIASGALAKKPEENPGGGHTPVTFCHKPGTPAQQELTTDDDGFLNGHLGHGDSIGSCPTIEEPPTETTPTETTPTETTPTETTPTETTPAATPTETPTGTTDSSAQLSAVQSSGNRSAVQTSGNSDGNGNAPKSHTQAGNITERQAVERALSGAGNTDNGVDFGG